MIENKLKPYNALCVGEPILYFRIKIRLLALGCDRLLFKINVLIRDENVWKMYDCPS